MCRGSDIWKDGVTFMIITGGKVVCTVGEGNRADYARAGTEPFWYSRGKGKDVALGYWELPADILEGCEKRFFAGLRSRLQKALKILTNEVGDTHGQPRI